jgi:uncharacterized membrane protein YqaE (UPF0057 family)
MSNSNLQPNEIDPSKWTLFDKIMYGGMGYGAFCLPSNFFNIVIAVIFPPLGEIVNIVGSTVSTTLPYLNFDVLKALLNYDSINRIIYSFLLTTLFYIPGLVYTLTNISDNDSLKLYEANASAFSSSSKEPIVKTRHTVPASFNPPKTNMPNT